MADLSGQRLGPFEIRELLGVGGFATVYRAHDPRLSSDVAIKILAENHSLEPRIRERFIGEAHALRRVQSENVLTVFDIRETDDGRPYLVLEHADRGDLRARRAQLIDKGQMVRAGDVRVLVEALTDALEAIHAEELVHRDVTPANVLIGSTRRQATRPHAALLGVDERFLLSDLGLVKDLAAGSGLTVGGGTAGFWAPEQRTPLAAVDHRTDLFAASGVVVWLLTGDAPVATPDWPTRLTDRGWSDEFVSLLARGLDPRPELRPATAGEWRDRLLEQLASESPSIGPDAPSDRAEAAEATAVRSSPVDALPPPGDGARSTNEPDIAVPAEPTTSHQFTPQPEAERSGPLLPVRVLAVAGTLVAATVLAVVLLRPAPLNAGATRLDGGLVAVTTQVGVAELTIVGPERFETGGAARYRTEASGVSDIIWTGPDGQRWTQSELEVEASGGGRGIVTATGRTDDGRVIETELEFDVEG